ncbi:AMP-binding protein [Rothia nasimurium]|uniref:AMP-binding protein n=1 Tax=Rothia nasimurium TaxID=85336 RepID=UPI0009F54D2D|nr:AMP-binding protein [Rothia nasimurium]
MSRIRNKNYLSTGGSVCRFKKGETLLSLGIKSGDKVIIFKSANFDSYLLANSVSYAGAVAIMISPHFSSEVFAQLHNRLNNSWVIFDDETRTQVEYADIPPTRKIDCLELSNEKLISSQTEISPRRWGTEDSIVYMTHTSGTTGIPKLIALSPNSMSWRVIFQRRMISGVYQSGIAA